MNTASKKAKGRNYQKKIVAKLKEHFGFSDDEIYSRSMGSQGEDIFFAPSARDTLPLSIEAKKQESLNIWKAIDQCYENCDDNLIPAVIFSKNNRDDYICIPFDDFLNIYVEYLKTKIYTPISSWGNYDKDGKQV